MEEHSEEAGNVDEVLSKKQSVLHDLILLLSDVQTLNGIALLVSGLAQFKGLSLYNLHILYDTINFTSVSNCAGIAVTFGYKREFRKLRIALVIIFLFLYVGFTITFGIRLRDWSDEKAGLCYNTVTIATSYSQHPTADYAYIGITCPFMIIVTVIALLAMGNKDRGFFKSEVSSLSPGQLAGNVFFYAFLQFPLHFYSVVALRASNQSRIDPASMSENEWGFGQVVSVILLAAILFECWKTWSSRWHVLFLIIWKANEQPLGYREWKAHRIERAGNKRAGDHERAGNERLGDDIELEAVPH
ncbi:hypothetical protein BT63DRAFT_450431 [Microthyrium microscopicum]|uniref:Uncharacterized protein n=1 Tax=Microthyrium microscopicum TaxID=703497 RepID=A0A6A6UT60_9PEZI|nr:hypothetical protein BT63DRAFT_450431 [Microthyrium microscopicum]